jgi:hypothetical protein
MALPPLALGVFSDQKRDCAGVSKTRRRQGKLKDIVFDPSDNVAAKRSRNTQAARLCRHRKATHVERLEARVVELEEENLQVAVIQLSKNVRSKRVLCCAPLT